MSAERPDATVTAMRTWSPGVMPRGERRGPAMTLEEWASRDEDAAGELVDGFLVEEEVPDFVHEAAVAWLVMRLGAWTRPRGGFVFASQIHYRVGERTGRVPDVSVFFGMPRRGRGMLQTHMPDIVVEVVSPRPRDERRDRVEKMTEYAQAGMRWYWLLDPALGSFEIFELTPNATYARVLAATEGIAGAVPGCDGLSLDLDALWSELASFPEAAEDEA
jgi:Uma2 family endonuclease